MSLDWTKIAAELSVRFSAFKSYSHTVLPKGNNSRFLMVSAALAIVAFVALPKNVGPVSEAMAEPVMAAAPDLSLYEMSEDLDMSAGFGTTKEIVLKSGDNLGPLLQKNGLSGSEAYQVTKAFAEVYKPQNLRPGHKFQLHYTADSLEHVTFKPNVESSVFVSRTGDNYKARKVSHSFKYETISVAANIKTSLYVDATKLGAPDKVVAQFANIYEYSVDFQRDIQPGDEFELFFEVARDRKGEIIKAGNLLYTSFSPRGKKMDYYLYEDKKGRENFYDVNGKTAKRKLRATPINGARLSSSYGRRKHPILGYRKMHAGVDFAARRGTPILAAGSGTVERANRYGSYGNYIRIRHTDGYKTAYAHLSKFANGVRAGKYVKQDQVIGYVGTTGRSTGPHLHYEVHHHGKKINPRRLSQLSGKPLSKDQIPNFKTRIGEIDRMRADSETIRPKVVNVEAPSTDGSSAAIASSAN